MNSLKLLLRADYEAKRNAASDAALALSICRERLKRPKLHERARGRLLVEEARLCEVCIAADNAQQAAWYEYRAVAGLLPPVVASPAARAAAVADLFEEA